MAREAFNKKQATNLVMRKLSNGIWSKIRKTPAFLAAACLGILACETPPQQEKWSGDLNGVWESAAYRVEINTPNNQDTTIIITIDEQDWKEKMNMKPIEAYFQADHKYIAEYRHLNDSLIRRHRGVWNTFGDTLVIIEPDAIYQYTMQWKNERVYFQSLVDWDADGKEDDVYYGIYRKK